MNEEQAKQLRAPFPANAIGKLPKPTKKENPKGRCEFCGGWHGLPAIHLDYVGHAATTDRLLQVDPEWTWKPMAVGPNGEPLMTDGGLWIELTVCGVTRPGFGDGANPKEIIGDAIRNAAMRFGVALDLWAKEDLQSEGGEMLPAPGVIAQPKPTNGDVDDIPFGPAPDDEGPTVAKPAERLTTPQARKLNVLIGKLRPDHITTENLYAALAKARNIDAESMIQLVGGEDAMGELHWAPLRDSLTKTEASDLIERLTKLETAVAT